MTIFGRFLLFFSCDKCCFSLCILKENFPENQPLAWWELLLVFLRTIIISCSCDKAEFLGEIKVSVCGEKLEELCKVFEAHASGLSPLLCCPGCHLETALLLEKRGSGGEKNQENWRTKGKQSVCRWECGWWGAAVGGSSMKAPCTGKWLCLTPCSLGSGRCSWANSQTAAVCLWS